MVSYILPEAFENGADVVADRKLVIEFASGSSMFNIWKRKQMLELKSKLFPTRIHRQHTTSLPYCLQRDELQAPSFKRWNSIPIQKSPS